MPLVPLSLRLLPDRDVARDRETFRRVGRRIIAIAQPDDNVVRAGTKFCPGRIEFEAAGIDGFFYQEYVAMNGDGGRPAIACLERHPNAESSFWLLVWSGHVSKPDKIVADRDQPLPAAPGRGGRLPYPGIPRALEYVAAFEEILFDNATCESVVFYAVVSIVGHPVVSNDEVDRTERNKCVLSIMDPHALNDGASRIDRDRSTVRTFHLAPGGGNRLGSENRPAHNAYRRRRLRQRYQPAVEAYPVRRTATQFMPSTTG